MSAHALFAQLDGLVDTQGGGVQTRHALLKALKPAITAEMIEESLKDEGVNHAKALVQNEWLKKLQEQGPLICRDELIVYITKKQICAADGDAVLKTDARQLFEVNRIGYRRLGMRRVTEGQGDILRQKISDSLPSQAPDTAAITREPCNCLRTPLIEVHPQSQR